MAGVKRYRAYYIEPGLADYSAEGIGLVLVQKPALDKMAPTFVGKPIVNFSHTDLEPEELFDLDPEEIEKFADGVIGNQGIDDETGWYWADMLVWDDETQHNIDVNGFTVSCAYDVTHSLSGGTYHNVQYDSEVSDGVYKHMAIVDNPRYEGAWVIQNSKSKEDAVFKKNRRNNEMDEPKEESMDNGYEEEGYVMREDGSKMSMNELVNKYREMKSSEGKMYNADDIINVDGEDVSVRDMLEMTKMENPGMHNADDDEEDMENEIPDQDEPAEDMVDESKQMSNAAARSAKKEQGKKNMNRVRNAVSQEVPFKPDLDIEIDRLERGRQRYSMPVSQKG